jgi:hypothetical protein
VQQVIQVNFCKIRFRFYYWFFVKKVAFLKPAFVVEKQLQLTSAKAGFKKLFGKSCLKIQLPKSCRKAAG